MKKILIIDDEVNVALLLSKFLSKNGFEVTTASNGSIGLEYLKNGDFNLVLCDFRLEDTDGREMLRSIKTQYPKTGVIIITGYSDIKMAVELIKMGAYDYITKPLYPDEILNTINKAIETHHALVEEKEETQVKEKTARDIKRQNFNGEFIAAEDVGTNPKDMEYIRMETEHVAGMPETIGGAGDPAPIAALGVFMGIKASVKELYGNDSLTGRSVIIQGIGHVGENLVRLLRDENAVSPKASRSRRPASRPPRGST